MKIDFGQENLDLIKEYVFREVCKVFGDEYALMWMQYPHPDIPYNKRPIDLLHDLRGLSRIQDLLALIRLGRINRMWYPSRVVSSSGSDVGTLLLEPDAGIYEEYFVLRPIQDGEETVVEALGVYSGFVQNLVQLRLVQPYRNQPADTQFYLPHKLVVGSRKLDPLSVMALESEQHGILTIQKEVGSIVRANAYSHGSPV